MKSFATDVRTKIWGKKNKVEKQIKDDENEEASLKKIIKNPSTIKVENCSNKYTYFCEHIVYIY